MIILDCSAAVEMIRKTPDGLGMKELIEQGEKVWAPELFHAELASTLWKFVRAKKMTHQQAFELVAEAQGLVDRFVPLDDFAIEALSEGARLGHSPYDMFYFVLARRCGATLATMDGKLIQLCEQQGVDCVHPVEV